MRVTDPVMVLHHVSLYTLMTCICMYVCVRACYKGTWLNKYETDSPLCVRLMASARIIEMSITCRKREKNKSVIMLRAMNKNYIYKTTKSLSNIFKNLILLFNKNAINCCVFYSSNPEKMCSYKNIKQRQFIVIGIHL